MLVLAGLLFAISLDLMASGFPTDALIYVDHPRLSSCCEAIELGCYCIAVSNLCPIYKPGLQIHLVCILMKMPWQH